MHKAEIQEDYPSYEAVWFQAGTRKSRRREEVKSIAEANATASVPTDFLPTVSFNHWKRLGSMTKRGKLVDFKLNLGGSELDLGDVPLVRADMHGEQEGYFDRCAVMSGGECWVFTRLTSICVQVRRAGSGWRLAPRSAGHNSTYGCKFHGAHHIWEAVTYTSEPLHTPRKVYPHGRPFIHTNASTAFDDFSIEVRFADDPFFKAVELTAGTLQFGMTKKEEDAIGIVLVIVGCVFFCIGAVAMCTKKKVADDEELASFAAVRNRRQWQCDEDEDGFSGAQDYAIPHRRRREPDPATMGVKYKEDLAEFSGRA